MNLVLTHVPIPAITIAPTYEILKKVNRDINSIPYLPEVVEDWSSITLTGGDCDSYATRKFEELIALGISTMALRLATCKTENGFHHAVLLVDIGDQTWVLDNRHEYPTEYQLLDYIWIKGQVAGTQLFERLP